MRILVTGGAGFIGSNFVGYILNKYSDYKVINFDTLTYAGNLDNLLAHEANPNYSFIKGDIADSDSVREVFGTEIDVVINFAAESHVDRSILDAGVFVKTNVLGTQVLLDAARKFGVKKFVQVSTDEVYGTLGSSGMFTEETPLAPNSPYSASKASADLIVRAYYQTFGLPVNITRCSNNYGPYQFPEKLIPLVIINALRGKAIPLYGDGTNVRDWLHVYDHCVGIDLVLHKGRLGEVYNIGGNNELPNISIVKTILRELGKPETLITFVRDRPGHDYRYAIDASKIKTELGWEPRHTIDSGLRDTIHWFIEHWDWLEMIQSKQQDCCLQQHWSRIPAES